MWSARISLLMHLGLFQEAEREMVAFEELQNPDLYYQYHTLSYPNKAGNHGNRVFSLPDNNEFVGWAKPSRSASKHLHALYYSSSHGPHCSLVL